VASADDLSLMPELITEGSYDAPFTAFLRRTLAAADVFVDVGANIGLFTVLAALQAGSGRIVSYEPVPALIELLRDNIQLNWVQDRVTVRPVAVADRAGRRSFAYDPRMQLLGGLTPTGEHVVEVVTLDDDLKDIERVNLVKIDAEGAEAEVLAGMRSLLDQSRVERVACEVRFDAFERMGRAGDWPRLVQALQRLEEHGWTFALIDPDGRERPHSLREIVATEPHPNVVARRPGLGTIER
jgi:FkbM family methyltransferase